MGPEKKNNREFKITALVLSIIYYQLFIVCIFLSQKKKLKYPVECLYGSRLFFEEKYFLTKSGSKWVLVGVLPKTEQNFVRVLRIHDSKGGWITFNEGQIHELFSKLREVIPVDGKCAALADISEKPNKEKVIHISKANYGTDIWKIENKNSDHLNNMIFGLNTLQRLIQLDNLIVFSFNSKDYIYAQHAFTKMVEEVQKMPANIRKDTYRVQQYLLDTATHHFNFGGASPFYTMARDTLANFEDFFKYTVNKA